MTRTTISNPTNAMDPKSALEGKLREVLQLAPSPEELLVERFPDPIDQVTCISDRDVAVQRLDSQSRVARDIQSALAKLAHGTYGVCERCDEPIAPKRLQAVPWARQCVSCQALTEAEGLGRGMELQEAA